MNEKIRRRFYQFLNSSSADSDFNNAERRWMPQRRGKVWRTPGNLSLTLAPFKQVNYTISLISRSSSILLLMNVDCEGAIGRYVTAARQLWTEREQ